jgi:hypothetical protein
MFFLTFEEKQIFSRTNESYQHNLKCKRADEPAGSRDQRPLRPQAWARRSSERSGFHPRLSSFLKKSTQGMNEGLTRLAIAI